MSHEIRTPLNAILGFSSFLKDKEVAEENVVKYAEIITNSGKHLLALINDIIDISIIEAGKLKVTNTHFELNNLLITLYNFFHSYLVSIKKFNVVLKLSISEIDTFIISDETRLRQIFMNLIGNAIKFTEKGIVEFGYSIEDKNIIFFVKDTGKGIREEKKDIIFNKFRKAANTKEKIYGGTGLGLSIAKACADMLNGDIWFESEIGVGTTFFFAIKYEQGINKKKDSGSTENLNYNFNNEVVLIAEDDAYNFAFLKKLIQENNLKILHSVTGRDTIKTVLEHDDISIILMDIKMPDLSGIDAAIEIKKHKPQIPIIAQTAFAYEKDKEEIMNAGCVEYLTKPIDANLLLRSINKHIIRKTGAI
jgi:CheY-like chemotaxis protein